MNACIVSYFMDNISMKTVELQSKVIEKFNVSNYPHYKVKGDLRHGVFMDYFWVINGVEDSGVFAQIDNHGIEVAYDHDVILFLDIDCIPLQNNSIDVYVQAAAKNRLVGNVQRSNHIQNGEHIFAAPSALAIHKDVFLQIGKPSAIETLRSDVAEEYTWACEAHGVPVDLFMPLKYERPPTECEYWKLKEGMPVYGQGTTFGDEVNGELFYHSFQIFHPGQQDRFQKRCESILEG